MIKTQEIAPTQAMHYVASRKIGHGKENKGGVVFVDIKVDQMFLCYKWK